MSWADEYIKELKEGRTSCFRPFGGSMKGRIESGQLVRVEPILDEASLSIGDVVLCQVGRSQYLHLIKAIDGPELKFLIGNNKGKTNGWIAGSFIYGKCISVVDQ